MTEHGTLAIDGGTPLRAAPWPSEPTVAPAREDAPVEVVERAIAQRLELHPGAAVAVAQPAEAFRLAFSVVGTGAGGEAVIPCLLEDEAAEVARTAGWTVVPGEVEADTAALSVRGLARAASDRTRLAVVGHAFGHPAVMNELAFVASNRGFALVEDLSGALGGISHGVAVGRFGTVGVLTGRAGDPLTHGAYVIVPEEAAAERVRSARTSPPAEEAARHALSQVLGLEAELTHRRQLAWELTFGLRGMRGLAAMPHGRWVRHAYPRYVIRLRSLVWKRPIEETVDALRAEGIPCERASGPSLHSEPWVRAALAGDPRLADDVFPAASRLPGELIAIPLHGGLTSREMDQVAAALKKVEAKST